MLDGARETLTSRAVGRLFIFTHSQALHETVVDRLNGHGYQIEVSSDFDTNTMSFDGLVVASSPLVRPELSDFVHLGRTAIATSSPERLVEYLLEVSCRSASARDTSAGSA